MLFQELANKKVVIQAREVTAMQQQIAAKAQLNSEISDQLQK